MLTSSTWVAAGMALVLPQNDAGGSPLPAVLTVQLNAAEPVAPVPSVAVTVTVDVLAVVGVPVISPEGADGQPGRQPGRGVGQRLPGGRVAGLHLQADRGAHGRGLAAGVGHRHRVAGLRGSTVQLNDAEPDAPVVSVAVTVTVEVPAVVGVPEISPVEELTDSPAGSPVAA